MEIEHSGFFDDLYVQNLFRGHKQGWRYVPAFFRRTNALIRRRSFDLLWVEKDLLPWLPYWVENVVLPRNLPIVMDIDDAVFHLYGDCSGWVLNRLLRNKFPRLAHRMHAVFAGSPYLFKQLTTMGYRNVLLVPSVVDLKNFCGGSDRKRNRERIVICWIGTPTTAPYLYGIKDALASLVESRSVEIVAIGAREEQLIGLPVRSLAWSEATQYALLSDMDIGIMPLPDLPFERGKCAYKIVQYLAAGLPVVGSPVGANVELLKEVGGILARSTEDWVKGLTSLVDDPSLRHSLGVAGRDLVRRRYSVQSQLPTMIDTFSRLAVGRG